MKKSVYYIIIVLIALPAGLMLGLQISTVEKQYQKNKENFKNEVEQAIREVGGVYGLWNSHTSNAEDKESYNSMYTNIDSTFSVLIAQSAQPYPLLDFTPDTLLPKIRKTQFLKFQKELEETRRKENKRLKEFYVLRSIQYCADCEDHTESVAEIFPLDSLIRNKLYDNGIDTEVEIAFYNTSLQQYGYATNISNSSKYSETSYSYPFTDNETLKLYFPQYKAVLRKELLSSIISSTGLVLISFVCFGFAARMLFKHKQFSKMKIDFINNVTHEFKTPIATINFALANIENDDVVKNPKAIKQFTKVIKTENERLNGQVEQVLKAAVLNNKAYQLKKEELDFHEIIEESINNNRSKLGDNDKISSELFAANYILNGDAFHLLNLVSNLLDNAIKYSSNNKVIHIQTSNKGEYVVLRITDNGIGISASDQKYIFDQFYRVPTGNLHKIKGFGLGLNYVKSIVEAHNGEIHLKSSPNEGSAFTILLPTI